MAPPLPSWLTSTLYAELHGLAERQFAGASPGDTLQPTALVHEAWLRIEHLDGVRAAGRGQVFALAAKVMRSVLVDHARRRGAQKRDGGRRQELDTQLAMPERGDPIDVLSLDEALGRLDAMDPELARLVELKFFAGLPDDDVAAALEVSTRTVRRGWRTARAWLRDALDERPPE
jgi:RNA polymerase sigma factor (TIGR02999 family)